MTVNIPRCATWPPYTWDTTDPEERQAAYAWLYGLLSDEQGSSAPQVPENGRGENNGLSSRPLPTGQEPVTVDWGERPMNPTDPIPVDIARFLVPGEPCVVAVVECGCSCHTLAPAQGVHCGCPPAAWAAVAGAPCVNCNATGVLDDGLSDPVPCDVPLCRGGVLLHELRVECDAWWCASTYGQNHDCDRIVPARIEVVPVVVKRSDVSGNCIVWTGSTAFLVTGATSKWRGLDPDHVPALMEHHHRPAAGWVGQYAIVATPEEQ